MDSGHLLFGTGAVPIAEMETTSAVMPEKSTSAWVIAFDPFWLQRQACRFAE